MKLRYQRIIPKTVSDEADSIFRKHCLVYHMTCIEKYMTPEEVQKEVESYRKCWSEDVSEQECSLSYVKSALEELEKVGLEISWWDDGVCKKCNSVVIEKGSIDEKYDYMNMCLNVSCSEHKLHYCYDDEFLDYYEHDSDNALENY